MSENLSKALTELKRDEVLDTLKRRIDNNDDPIQLLEECREGMTVVGELYQKGEYYLAEMMLSAKIFSEATTLLEPALSKARPTEAMGRIVLATMKGDIHDLGKNIVAALLKAQGFLVDDLGVDVEPARVFEKVKEVKPDFVGFSCLMTGAFDAMKQTSEMLEEAGLKDKLKMMVGGGVVTSRVKEYINADFHTVDAAEGVDYCMKEIGGK
ncbi:MAG: cobalamin-binding protein [Desulfobacteraceae bacterium]|nr:cobalamin B12-binding domain-containing protein [Desulfobacteraceae bacterium]MBC2756388.1 cobalamin-binding protein [Desulfobacteraceae bacterium]